MWWHIWSSITDVDPHQPTAGGAPLATYIQFKSFLLMYRVPARSAPLSGTVLFESCPPSAVILTWASSGETICSDTAIETLLIPFSLMVEWAPELCQSRNYTLYLLEALEEAALLRVSSILTTLLSPSPLYSSWLPLQSSTLIVGSCSS